LLESNSRKWPKLRKKKGVRKWEREEEEERSEIVEPSRKRADVV